MAQSKHDRTSPQTSPTCAFDTSTDSDGGIILSSQNRAVDDASKSSLNRRPKFDFPQYELELPVHQPYRVVDWCDKGFHVDFRIGEDVPLRRGRLLGHGSQGGVYETECKGVQLAWKIKYCRRKSQQISQRREVDILKRLSHHHIVKLMGTYAKGLELGLLIWPVAICDLATFMEDIDILHGHLAGAMICDKEDDQIGLTSSRIGALIPDADDEMSAYIAAVTRLSTCFGCLVSAIDYVHDQRVRHKDIKPHNVLLSLHGLWLADFGISSDFSAFSSSQSEAIYRGTPRYYAPEVAADERSGRAADIFSLGCIFLEMLALIKGVSIAELRDCSPEHKGSFQMNLRHKQEWFKLIKSRSAQQRHLLCEVEAMIETEPRSRPTARQLNKRFVVISQLGSARSPPLHGPCCQPEHSETTIAQMETENANLRLVLRERDRYIDRLLASTSPSASLSSLDLPPPPMGPNCLASDTLAESLHVRHG